MKITPTEEVGSNEAIYGNDDTELYKGILRKPERKKKQSDDFKSNEVINEKDIGKKRLCVTPKESKDDKSKNPQPFKLELSPLVYNIILSIASKKQQDFLETSVEITSSGVAAFIHEMDSRYVKMCEINSSISVYNTMKGSNIKMSQTEVFSSKDYIKEKVKIMVTSSVNSWIHKYSMIFKVELSDVYSALVLFSHFNSKITDEETKSRCTSDLSLFYEHIDNKIEKLADSPPEFKTLVPYYLDLLRVLDVKKRVEYIEHSGIKGTVVFIPDVSRDMMKKSRHVNGIFEKKTGRKSKGV